MYRNILVAIDGSQAAAAALDEAIDLARSDGARLVLISVAAPPRLRLAAPLYVSLVPHADCTIFLAVWHHLVRHQGLEAADTVLSELWRSTGTVLFFETGEDREMPEYYRLPAMTPDPRTWIESHLEQTCAGGSVRHLGLHASSPTYSRNLFAVVRANGPG